MKKKMKKILAFLCAVVLFVTAVFTEGAMNQAQAETETSTEATSTEPTPVELYGFENVTLNDFVHVSTGSAMHEGEYVYGTDYTYTNSADTNFDKQLFSANVKFITSGGWWTNVIRIGGTASNWGIGVGVNGTEQLMISELDADWDGDGNKEFERTITADQAGVTSFGESFLLQIGYEYLTNDTDGEANDVRVLVYVNGTEVLNEVVSNCDMTRFGNYVRFYIENSSDSIVMTDVELPVEPVELTGFNNVTPGDFTNTSASTTMEETTYTTDQTFALTNETDFNKKLFTAYVKPANSTNWWGWRICLGGTSSKWGVALCVNSSGDTLTVAEFDSDIDENSDQQFSHSISASTAKVTSFVTEPFLLQMGLEYLDNDGDGSENDVRVLLYVNGNAVFNQVLSNCNMSNLGNYLRFYLESGSIEVGTFQSEVKPVTLSSHKTVTISDFQDSAGKEMESKAYDYDAVTQNSSFSLKDGSTSFINKLLSMKVKFGYKEGVTPSWETRMVIPAADGTNGIFMYVNSDGALRIEDKIGNDHGEQITCETAGVSSFQNTPFILQISFTDTSNGLALGVYIDGKLCGTYPWTEATSADYGSKIDLTRGLENSFITVSSIDKGEFPADPLVQPNSTFEKITFGSFGCIDGTYSSIEGTYNGATNVDKKVVCGNIKLNGSGLFQFVLGGKDSNWDGLRLMANSATSMEVKWWNGSNSTLVETFTSDEAGVDFIGQAYDLMISMEVVDDDSDGTSDVKFGVWFDNVLYGDKYYVAYGGGDNLGNKLGIYGPTGGTITLGSVKELLPQPDESYEKVTFQNFAIKDGEYDSKADNFIFKSALKTKDNLDGIVVCGDIFLTDKGDTNNYSLILGEKNSETWNGIHMWIQDSTMSVSAGGDNSIIITSSDAGLGSTFDGQDISLMWSVDFIDGDEDSDTTENDIKIGLWFNGFLYQNQYSTIYNAGTAADFGNTFAVCCPGDGDTITINSAEDIMNLPGEDFGKLSLPDFVHNGTTDDRMASGSFSTAVVDNTWYVAGHAKDHTTLDKKVVSFDILQNGIANSDSYNIRIGGKDNYWYGLALDTTADGSMVLGWFGESGQYEGTWYSISKDEAAVSSFVNETFNLTVSMELVDENGNGTSDVKVRIWFNKIPYVHEGQNYFLFSDRGNELGNILAMKANNASDNGVANISLRTEKGYQSNPYYYENIAEYRGTTKTAPEAPAGYVFSGWYTDENYTEYLEPTVTSGSAYAKFVEEDVLSAKPQVRLADPQVDSNGDGKYDLPAGSTDLRVATTVDHLNYRRISFFIARAGEDGTYGSEYNTATSDENARLVYEKLYAIGKDEEMTYVPTAFSWQSDYFKTFTITGIPEAAWDTMMKVTPYWITMDGTLVRGKVLETCVNDYINNKSQAVSVKYIGDDTMPITGYHGPYVLQDADDVMLFPEYVTDDYFKMIADSGVNVTILEAMDYVAYPSLVKKALALGEKYGIGIYVEDSKLLELASADVTDETKKQNIETRIAEYSVYESFAGIHLVDEPGTDDFHSNEKLVSTYEALAGFLNELGVYTYVNMYPFDEEAASWWENITGTSSEDKYSDYVAEINETLSPVALMWDMYPFSVAEGGTELDVDISRYFWNMAEIRRQAQLNNKPFWAYVQAGANFSDTYENAYFNTKVYAPNKGQFNWNMNTALAFGAQGIQYFELIQPDYFAYAGTSAADGMWDFNRNGLIGAFGNKTQWYDYAQAANTHVGAIDGVLMDSYSTQIIALGDAATATKDLTSMGVTTSAAYEELTSVTDGADVLIGCFDYKGKTALYVVNYNYDAKQEGIELTFTGTYDITKIENAVTTEESASSLTLDMEAGEGILLVIE